MTSYVFMTRNAFFNLFIGWCVGDTNNPSSSNRCEEESEQWSTWETERHKTEAERLKRQVGALKDTEERRKDAIRDRDSVVNRSEILLASTYIQSTNLMILVKHFQGMLYTLQDTF